MTAHYLPGKNYKQVTIYACKQYDQCEEYDQMWKIIYEIMLNEKRLITGWESRATFNPEGYVPWGGNWGKFLKITFSVGEPCSLTIETKLYIFVLAACKSQLFKTVWSMRPKVSGSAPWSLREFPFLRAAAAFLAGFLGAACARSARAEPRPESAGVGRAAGESRLPRATPIGSSAQSPRRSHFHLHSQYTDPFLARVKSLCVVG